MMTKRNDYAKYRAVDVPFADSDAANANIKAFFDGIEKLREQCKISDVGVIVECPIMIDGIETRGGASLFLGHEGNKLPMLARTYGAAQQEHRDNLALISARERRRSK